jgi:hypothetical protein
LALKRLRLSPPLSPSKDANGQMGNAKVKIARTDAENLVSNLRGEVGEVITTWLLMRNFTGLSGQARTGDIVSIPGTVERADSRYQACFHAGGFTVGIGWYPSQYLNTVEDGRLVATLFRGTWRLAPSIYINGPPPRVRTTRYQFDVAPAGHRPYWRVERGDDPPVTTPVLAGACHWAVVRSHRNDTATKASIGPFSRR